MAALGTVACGSDDDDDGGGDTVALADSGSLAELTTEIEGIPTTVAVTGGYAWVVESQFDRYAPFGGTGAPAPFRLVGVSLADGSYDEIPLPNNFFPEGITVTPGGRMYVGSVATGAVYTIAPNTAVAAPFFLDLPPSTIGLTIGSDNATVWACNSDTAAGTGRVVGIDIATSSIIATHELPPAPGAPGAFCNDMVVDPGGSLWVTESFGGRIFRIPSADLFRNDSAEIWLEDAKLGPPEPGQFGVNGITLVGGRLFAAVTDPGVLFSIDPTLDAPTGDDLREVSLSFVGRGGSVQLVRPDGITAVPGSNTDLLIVENGLGTDSGKKLLRASIDRL